MSSISKIGGRWSKGGCKERGKRLVFWDWRGGSVLKGEEGEQRKNKRHCKGTRLGLQNTAGQQNGRTYTGSRHWKP